MSTALYRRYRPETFADVIGQEHVTEPLMAALRANRVTHAYLFSGPRGCGKTTSARILARCLNCAEGPTDTPCGTCDSCVELARGGPGSLDVVEIDAASHNGVDDARELRERAAFAPARDRYKIFILDEAHMVTTQGFNALLKLVEEPPAHVKFVFATTEPDKVIGTIRSRTHHYPFRLVPPEQLTAYLDRLATAENIAVASGVLPLVVRAGGGSVRDSLSVLDQLIAGADAGEVTYERAVALLGFTHGALLDDAIDALAARDGASLFRVVERVIDSGHAPRRFVEDLLERMRDLIVVLAAGDQAATVLRAVPEDQLDRMRVQAQHLGLGALSRAADLVNLALTEMIGATSPRLQLELLCARLLLPAADDGVDGFNARLDRLESAVSTGAPLPPRAAAPAPAIAAPVAAPPRTPPAVTTPPVVERSAPAPVDAAGPGPARVEAAEVNAPGVAEARPAEAAPVGSEPEPVLAEAAPVGSEPVVSEPVAVPDVVPVPPVQATPSAPPVEAAPPARPAASQAPAATPASGSASGAGGMTAEQVRRRWPEVLETLTRIKRTTWALISQDAQVVDLSATTLSLGFSTPGLASAFRNGGHGDHLQRALSETLGLSVRIDAVVADGSAGQVPPAGGAAPAATGPADARATGSDAVSRAEADWGRTPAPAAPSAQPEPASAAPTASASPAPPTPAGPAATTTAGPPESAARATAPATPAGPASSAGPAAAAPTPPAAAPVAPAPAANEPAPAPREEASGPGVPSDAGAVDDFPPPPWDVPGDASGPDQDPPSGGLRRGAGPGDPPAPSGGRAPVPDDDIPPAEPPDFDDGPAPEYSAPRSAAPRDHGSAAPGGPVPRGGAPTDHGPGGDAPRSARDAAFAAARAHTGGAGPRAQAGGPGDGDRTPSGAAAVVDEPDMSDPDIESSGLIGAPLVARLLGGTVIDEITETTDGQY